MNVIALSAFAVGIGDIGDRLSLLSTTLVAVTAYQTVINENIPSLSNGTFVFFSWFCMDVYVYFCRLCKFFVDSIHGNDFTWMFVDFTWDCMDLCGSTQNIYIYIYIVYVAVNDQTRGLTGHTIQKRVQTIIAISHQNIRKPTVVGVNFLTCLQHLTRNKPAQMFLGFTG